MRYILAVILFAGCLMAQPTQSVQWVTTNPSGTCGDLSPLQFNYANGNLSGCVNATWTVISGGAGSGTVTSVTILGTANELTASGTCTITSAGTCTFAIASPLTLPGNMSVPSGAITLGTNGGTGGTLNLNGSSGVGSDVTLSTNSAGSLFLFNAGLSVTGGAVFTGTVQGSSWSVTNAGALTVSSCSGCGSGSSAFSSLTGGTNTSAAMVVGSGASLGVTGSGSISASTISGGAANDLVYQAGSGTTGFLASCASGVWGTNGSDVPSCSTTLPSGLSIPGYAALSGATFTGTIQAASWSLTAGGVLTVASCSGCGSSGGSWSSLGNASANLTLSNAGYTTTFDQTSGVAWSWANTTAATSSASQSSPIMEWLGTEWHSSASVTGGITAQFVPGTGADAASTFQISHTGSATGTVTTALPGPVSTASDGVHPGLAEFPGNTTAPTIPSNMFALIGPNAATFTAYGLQFPTTNPGANQVIAVGAPSSGVAPISFISNATTVNGQTCTLGSTCTVSVSNVGGGSANEVLYQTGVGATGFITPCASGAMVYNGSDVPQCSNTMPTGMAYSTPGSINLANGSNLPLTGITGGSTAGILQTTNLGVVSASPALANGTTAATQSAGDNSTKVADTAYVNTVYNLIQTSGSPYTMSALTGTYWNNTASAYSWDLPTPVSGLQLCVGNYQAQATAQSLIPPSGVTIYFKGAAGTAGSSTGLVSGGAAGDFICLEGTSSTTYMAIGAGYGTWTNH